MKKYRKIALFMAICLIVTSVTAFPRSTSAGVKGLEFSNEEDAGYISVDGEDYSDECAIIYSSKITYEIHVGIHYSYVHLKDDGTAWYIYEGKLKCYNHYATGSKIDTGIVATEIYDNSTGSAYCYKTPSGEYYYLPSYDDLKNKNYVTEKVSDEDIPADTPETQPPVVTNSPTPTNKPTPTPGSGVSKPGGIDTIVVIYPTKKPQDPQISQTSPVSQEPETPKTSETKVTKSGKSVEVTQNGEVISKVTFNKKKGTATFKVKNKNKKVKKIKQAFVIGDSYNYGYITKANKFKTINRKTGKVKTYSGKWKKATIKKNVAVNVVKLKGSKKKKITGF